MKNKQFTVYHIFALALVLFLIVPLTKVYAYTTPFYAYGEVYTTSALWFPTVPAPDWKFQNDTSGAPVSISISAGHTNDEIGGYYSDGSTLTPVYYRPASYGSVSADAGMGSIKAYSSTYHGSTGGTPVSWEVQLPGTNPFIHTPLNWGDASAFGYIRNVWEITSTDGSLQTGDPVSIEANLNIEGILSGNTSTVRAMLFLNKIENIEWLNFTEYINFATVDDHFYDDLAPVLQYMNTRDQSGSISLSQPNSTTMNFQVGDIIVMEALLETTSFLINDGLERSTKADFENTLEAFLLPQTSGAGLELYGDPVPIPGTIWLLVCGFIGLLGLKKRQSNRSYQK